MIRKFSIYIAALLFLTSCSENLIVSKNRPTYEVQEQMVEPITKQGLLKNILETEDQEHSTSSEKKSSIAQSNHTSKIADDTIGEMRTVRVTRIYDSDTLEFFDPQTGKKSIGRLIGINGPEYTKEKQLYGKESTEFLKALILNKDIQIESDPNADIKDKYGRYLIHSFIGGKNIQYILLANGLVRVAYLYGEYKYIDSFKEAEGKAKESALNIWSIPGYVDNKNGFNMNAVKNNAKEKITSNLKELSKKLLSN
ncbi:hypothetical protein D1B31_18445 [Neobacillus notoginsengisoli]|uniref:TNase-like domain-containing protein n=1 Tax=Neobacillus notoginsengisoli TaxID=1578198 RepID=A0A417YQA6_9BACI|nr:thermonuclease family protein [Neobacillus notoginsengisoli]RHW36059.1 hypothetical protein D1B31_18445 [Neobacillus notoginsengisoli]